MSFAGKGRVSNLARPYAFETSPQYLLRKTYDMRILQPYNVRYIFDFSNIYNSEYKRYLPSKIAKENSQILEQDKNFLKNFKDLHPEEITEVSPGIYKLLDASGTVFGFNNIYCSRTKEQNFTSQMYRLFGQYVYSTDRACDTGDFIDVLNFSRLVKNVKLLDSFKRNEIFTSDSVSVYTAAESKEYYVKNTGLKLDIYIKEKGAGTIISTSTVAQIPLEEKGARYFVQIRDRILQVPENIEVYIGTKVDTPKIVLFKEEPVKIDFEGVATFDLNLQQRYLVSFDYKGRKGTYLGYMISRSDGTSKNKISESILLTDNTWNTYIKIYNPQVIGKQEDEYRIQFKDVSGLEYANKKISTLKMVHSIDLDTEVGYTRKVVNKTEVLDMIDTYQKFYAENLIQDGGFEEGTWSDVALCHKDGPEYTYAEAEQTQTDKVEGSNSLLLKSKRAVACVKKSVQVKAGSSYNFSFAYKGEVGGVASYRIDYNNAKGDQYRDSVDITDTNWGMYEKEILVPAGATKATIYLLSRGSDSDAVATHMYDNVHMRRLLYPDNSVYLVEVKESTNINDNIEIWYKDINPTKTEVTITHAAFPFYLGYSESYHPDWKVRPLVTKGGISANPMYTDGVLSEKKHFKINEYFSAWYFNPQEFCAEQPQSCVKNDDGTYTIRLVIEFWPQRWFVIFLTISFLTLGISVISLFHAYHLGHVNYLSLFKRKTPDIL
jgi:hypothetical protein